MMKIRFTLYLLLFVTFAFAQKNQEVWKSDLDFGAGTVFTTFLEIEKSDQQFTITSPKNADIRMLGCFKAKLARLIGKSPKKGIIATIKGEQIGDSLFGNTIIPVIGNLEFKGVMAKNELRGEFLKDGTKTGTLIGFKSDKNRSDYTYLYPKILATTQDTIFSKSVLQTKEWNKFQKKLQNLCNNAHDDIELFMAFNMLSAKLPFSHYYLIVNTMDEDEAREEIEPTVIFEEKNSQTAYLQVKNFSTSKKELASTLPKIVEKNYQNLIVDLRNNGGGGIEPAFEFAKHIFDETAEVGYFVTNKLHYTDFDKEIFEKLPEVIPQTTKEFIDGLKKGKGAKLIFKESNNKVFSGNVFVLTNGNTGSTCEPLVYVLKEKIGALIVGENTAGAMLSAAFFKITGKYQLFLPIADFYTYDGVRLEGVGVRPNIEVPSDQALDKVLEIINNTK